MDTVKRQKIHNALCIAIAYATKAFLAFMAVVFGLVFMVCLVQLFQEPAIGLIGGVGFGGGAWILWKTQKAVQTRQSHERPRPNPLPRMRRHWITPLEERHLHKVQRHRRTD